MDTCACMAESLHCSSETITKLLLVYIPIYTVSGVKKINKNKIKKKFITAYTFFLAWKLIPISV